MPWYPADIGQAAGGSSASLQSEVVGKTEGVSEPGLLREDFRFPERRACRQKEDTSSCLGIWV